MLRIVFGVIAGFFAWFILWVGSELLLSAIWPVEFGAHQRAFQEAIENGGPYTADTRMLLVHIVLGFIVSALAGFLAALIAGENRRAPLALGLLLLAMGLLKVVMSWPFVPIWYHVIFTALLMPMTIVGGRLRTTFNPITWRR
jgi:sterol desaturase/sphingolipid hydroxylase (fatty acid hydroxylase superfamily)